MELQYENMNKVYIAQAYQKVASAGSKPSSDFEKVLQRNGFKNIGLPSIYTKYPFIWWLYNYLSFVVASFRISRKSVVALQYPDQRWLSKIFNKILKRKAKAITLVHDINELRGWESFDINVLKESDVLIAHSSNMKTWLEGKYQRKQILVLGIFDYLMPKPSEETDFELNGGYKIVYAGRLNKSGFLDKVSIPDTSDVSLTLYGIGCPEQLKSKVFVDYRGVCSPESLIDNIKECHFGLVWDGDSIDKCDGPMGEYLKYNSPYKLSSYLAAGLPVIVWKKSAMSKFVEENGIGFTVDSIDKIDERLSSLSKQEYLSMRRNACVIQLRITEGYYYDSAIKTALESLYK